MKCDYCHVRKSREELKTHIKTNHSASVSIKPRSIPYRERRKEVLLRSRAIMNDRKHKRTNTIEENGTRVKEKENDVEMDVSGNTLENNEIEICNTNKNADQDVGQQLITGKTTEKETITELQNDETTEHKASEMQQSSSNDEIIGANVDEQIGITVEKQSIRTQTGDDVMHCKECPKLKSEQAKLVEENVKEKAARFKAETNFDTKSKRHESVIKSNTNLQKEIQKLEEGRKKLIDALSKKMRKQKENENIIKTITNKNTDIEN